jgi:hypothetical protein
MEFRAKNKRIRAVTQTLIYTTGLGSSIFFPLLAVMVIDTT